MSDSNTPDFEQWPQGAGQYQPAPPPAAPQYGMHPGPNMMPAQGNGLGVAGFVTGLLGLILFWLPFIDLVLSLLGIVLGGVGLAQGNKKNAPTGLAIAGLVLGIVALIPAVIFTAVFA